MGDGTCRRLPPLAVFLLAAFLLPLLAACSGGEPGDRTHEDPTGGAATTPTAPSTGPSGRSSAVRNEEPWWPHPIDWRYKGANGLGAGDVNDDGFTDYVTNYEFDQRYVVALHPGTGADPTGPWSTVDVWSPPCWEDGCGVNPENATLGDLDGDGHLDVVAAQGYSDVTFWEGSEPGIRVVWGPPPDQVEDPAAWQDAGRIPTTADQGHYHFLRVHDVNGDGAADVVAGGRVHGGNGSVAGLLWLEAPAAPEQRRDLGAWARHDIDPDQPGTRNFVLADLDGDGDDDIVVANADFDTPAADEALVWYENPGTADPAAQRGRWPVTEIYRGDEFHTKPQVVVVDLDDDGLLDLVTQVPDEVWWFRATGSDPPAWERVVIPKAPQARAAARTLAVADLDADGRLDLVGGLVHEEGTLAGDKASLFWMSYDGEAPGADNWTTRTVTWGAGATGGFPEFGEKWDLMDTVDVDGDGDVDLVANNEEWWEDGGGATPFWEEHPPAVQAVVWFENRLDEAPVPAAAQDGLWSLEAEAWAHAGDGSWTTRTVIPDYSGHGYLQATGVLEDTPVAWEDSSGVSLAFEVDEAEAGEVTVWVRLSTPAVWGHELGGTASDSAWVGVDDALLGVAGDRTAGDAGPGEDWAWTSVGTVEVAGGSHTLDLRAREGGVRVDAVVLATDPTYRPR